MRALVVLLVVLATSAVAQTPASRPGPKLTARADDWTPPSPTAKLVSDEPFATDLGPNDPIYPGLGPCKTFDFEVEAPGPETAVYLHPRFVGDAGRAVDTLLRL